MECAKAEIAEERIKAAATAAKTHVLDWCAWLTQETPLHETEQGACPGTPTVPSAGIIASRARENATQKRVRMSRRICYMLCPTSMSACLHRDLSRRAPSHQTSTEHVLPREQFTQFYCIAPSPRPRRFFQRLLSLAVSSPRRFRTCDGKEGGGACCRRRGSAGPARTRTDSVRCSTAEQLPRLKISFVTTTARRKGNARPIACEFVYFEHAS